MYMYFKCKYYLFKHKNHYVKKVLLLIPLYKKKRKKQTKAERFAGKARAGIKVLGLEPTLSIPKLYWVLATEGWAIKHCP